METPYSATEEIEVLPSYVPVPGYGLLPVNAFLLKAREPVLVDAGVVAERDDFYSALCSIIDPQELRWLWLTHTDPDHIGGVERLLAEAPQLRIITTFIGAGKLGLISPVPMERVYLLNPGQPIEVGDRTLTAIKPPCFDAPETTGFFDGKSRALFSSDCFGAVLPAPAQDARDISGNDLAEFQKLWATVDAPWLHGVDRRLFGEALDSVRELSPSVVLSSHLPVAAGMTEQFLKTLASAVEHVPFVGPDQEALRQQMTAQANGNAAG